MPLSKKRNRDRMKNIRLHDWILHRKGSEPVQPKQAIKADIKADVLVDADGQAIPDYC